MDQRMPTPAQQSLSQKIKGNKAAYQGTLNANPRTNTVRQSIHTVRDSFGRKWVDWSVKSSGESGQPGDKGQHGNDIVRVLKNDHLENYVLTSKRPQNYVRDSDPSTRFLDYPKLETLFGLKREVVHQSATPSRSVKIDLWKYDLKNLGSQFDVILIDPPLIEYAARSLEYFEKACKENPTSFEHNLKLLWSWDDVAEMNIQDIAAPRSFIFIWTGDGEGLERGRDLLARWGYRRAEDIVWAKTNKTWIVSF
ncbi:N6-adenosine-methyltransferase subunit mettl14 [Entophlyctis luteolus]|nr:N6-adenosine-methyltransferase subunit mettl14 [Entophlyctis luteolus]KAJ3338347.1 N6-adenosine-methyltransferase subunit mettl14 [Entophlyctis luteolus]